MAWYDDLFGKDGFIGNIGQLGSFVGGIGQAKAALDQGKAAREMLNLEKESYFDEKKRRKNTQLALDKSFGNLNTTMPSLPL